MSNANTNGENTPPEVDSDLRWFVLRTHSRQEKVVARFLQGAGIEQYLPLTRSATYHGSRKIDIRVPLFSGYLFLFGSLDQAYRADRNRRVAQLIHVVDQKRLEWELKNVRLAESCDAVLTPHDYLAEGDLVEVRCGPFKGIQGYVDRVRSNDQLVLQVESFGRGASLQIDRGLLEPVS